MTQQPVDYATLRHLMTLQCQRRTSPSSPWSWMGLGTDAGGFTTEPSCPTGCIHTDCSRAWSKYPQSLFSNWTPSHAENSGLAKALICRPCENDMEPACIVRGIDLRVAYEYDSDGYCGPEVNVVFEKSKEHVVFEENKEEFHSEIQGERSSDIRVRALFVENLSGPVLQILGTKYYIDPLFFSSLLNWIPSRCCESPRGQGEHMTVIFPFLCAMHDSNSKVNTKSQLQLSPNSILVVDFLAIHVVVNQGSGTILSFSPSHDHLRYRIWDARQSSYWQNLFRTSEDPRLFLLLYLWYVLYAWDEGLEMVYSHITAMELEAQGHGGVALIDKLHLIRCHLLNYSSILEEFSESVNFLSTSTFSNYPSGNGARECRVLQSEINRLEKSLTKPSAKLENLIRLTESQRTQALIRLTAYLILVILPAVFISGVFLAVRGSVAQYFGTVIPLMVLSTWIVGTFQTKHGLNNSQVDHWSGFGWPFLVFRKWFSMGCPRR